MSFVRGILFTRLFGEFYEHCLDITSGKRRERKNFPTLRGTLVTESCSWLVSTSAPSRKVVTFSLHFRVLVVLRISVYSDSSEPVYHFAIVTTDASKALSWLHDRQPVILSSMDDVMRWLDTSSQSWSSELAGLLHPWEDTEAPLRW